MFDYPSPWREFHYQNVSTMSSVIAYLATVEVHDRASLGECDVLRTRV